MLIPFFYKRRIQLNKKHNISIINKHLCLIKFIIQIIYLKLNIKITFNSSIYFKTTMQSSGSKSGYGSPFAERFSKISEKLGTIPLN